MNTVRNVVAAAAAVAAIVVAAGTAHADPTPEPTPGYQIPSGSGPQLPGNQTYQPACLRNMRACGFEYDPSTGAWDAPPGTDPP
jgi:hypothetical protein